MRDLVRRRDFLALLAGGAAAWAPAARAQGRTAPVIGYLCPESRDLFASRLKAFHEGLAESGYMEGRNLTVDYQWAEGQYKRLPGMAADLVTRDVDLIVAPGGAQSGLAAKNATPAKSIVFEMGGDPVRLGLVESLSRPGANITGVSSLSVEVSRKRLEFMHELRPEATTFAVIANPTSPTVKAQMADLDAAAQILRLRLLIFYPNTEAEFEPAFATAAREGAGGMVFTSDPFFAFRSNKLAALALQYNLPAITQSRDFPNAGGLMSYGGDFMQSHRRAGMYVARILKGEKPSDLPVQLVTKLEFVINLKTAQALGLTVPQTLISGADEVIE